MCGIAGYFVHGESARADIAKKMAETMVHRGPDDFGEWNEASIALSFRRLAIIDLSHSGHQPMVSRCKRFVIVFNGEIYNYQSLRKELGGEWRGQSDTEVLLAAISQWGLKNAARRLRGMFAAAIWDRKASRLFLLRDRLGKKPIYYGWFGNAFVFASELKALARHPAFRAEIDRESLSQYLRYASVPAPRSIYRGVFKLPAGTFLEIGGQFESEPQAYWQAEELTKRTLWSGSYEEAVGELDRVLREAVRLRMVSDVPVGAFLSGGIDSSLVVSLMQAQSEKPARTFTIGFDDSDCDESVRAREIARHLETNHTELILQPKDALSVIPRLPIYFDEPFADSSQIPTMIVSELARKHVTVVLTGDGGDELFAGYNRYLWLRNIWGKTSWLPGSVRRALAKTVRQIPDRIVSQIKFVASPKNKLEKISGILASNTLEQAYRSLISQWQNPDQVVLESQGLTETGRNPNGLCFEEYLMFQDLISYLPDDNLTKVDRATMANSLEARCPFLDSQVVEFAWQLPLSFKMRKKEGKIILKTLLEKHVPRSIFEGPKKGFGLPLVNWLRGELRDWAQSLIQEDKIKSEGYFDYRLVSQKWNALLERREENPNAIWTVLMFQAWLEQAPHLRVGSTLTFTSQAQACSELN